MKYLGQLIDKIATAAGCFKLSATTVRRIAKPPILTAKALFPKTVIWEKVGGEAIILTIVVRQVDLAALSGRDQSDTVFCHTCSRATTEKMYWSYNAKTGSTSKGFNNSKDAIVKFSNHEGTGL